MRPALVLWMLLFAAVAGCFGGDAPDTPGTPTGTTTGPSGTSTGTSDPSENGRLEGTVRDQDVPVEGALVELRTASLQTTTDASGAYVFPSVPKGRHDLRATSADGTRVAELEIFVAANSRTTVDLELDEATTLPEPPGPGPVAGTFDCPDGPVTEPWLSFGRDASGVAWGALKTGFRFLVAAPGGATTLTYSLDGGAWKTAAPSYGAGQIFLLDDLREGGTLCFRVDDGAVHAAHLVNGPTSYDARDGTYSINLFFVAAEGADPAVLTDGMPILASTLWDATDGHVRVGNVFIDYGDTADLAATVGPCNTPVLSVNLGTSGLCSNTMDLYFTYQEVPLYSGSTPRRGIEGPFHTIRMNQLYEAGPLGGTGEAAAFEVGRVLAHELGHYAFDMMDMYTAVGNGPDCVDTALSLSVMSSDRAMTEYDDADHRCPNEAEIATERGAYVPAWTSLIGYYPMIPARPEGPDPGPLGDGEGFAAVVVET